MPEATEADLNADIPAGWRTLSKDDRSSTVGWFIGGYERAAGDRTVEVQIWMPATVDCWYVFPAEDVEDGTEAPRYDVMLIRDPRGDHDVIEKERGFEDDRAEAKRTARDFAENYDPTEGGNAD
jgi:hypothetical protein